MTPPEQKHTTPLSLIIDGVLIIAFFLFIYTLVSPHVPSNDPFWILLWGGLTAACMTGVFWLCIQMFRVVLKNQRASSKR